MALSSQTRIERGRFASYVEELRDFSTSRRIRWGNPEDLINLLTELKRNGTFSAEFGSMIRSIVYREHCDAPLAELLTLVAVAWGGSKAGDPTEALQAAIHDLAEFLRSVMKIPRLEPVSDNSEKIVQCSSPIEIASSYASVDRLETKPGGPECGVEGKEAMYLGAAIPDIEREIHELELRSPEVRRYAQLLMARGEKTGTRDTAPAIEEVAVNVDLSASSPIDQRLTSHAARSAEDDPWAENSELHKELQSFARQKAANTAAEQLAHITARHKVLAAAEAARTYFVESGANVLRAGNRRR